MREPLPLGFVRCVLLALSLARHEFSAISPTSAAGLLPPPILPATGTSRHLLQNDGAEAAAVRPAAAAASPPAPARLPPRPPNVTPQGVPPNITVVNTAEELQTALLSGAVDIEVQSHLDMRTIALVPNPMIQGSETANHRKRIALMYATPPLRSVRGNCSEPDAAAALSLSANVSSDLLPLKPFQCLLIVNQTWLMVNGGEIWIDNIYLKLSRRLARPNFAFITAGALNAENTWPNVNRSNVFVTGSTFQSEHRGNARGFIADLTAVAVYINDCIFSDWSGFHSPLTIKYQSVANVRNTVFRNMALAVEIADVSYEGMVRFANVSFANVTLAHGAVVSTTLNDYQEAIGFYLTYYAEDDAAYDVVLETVPAGEGGVFGAEFRIEEQTLSDCIYLLASAGTVLPGCPTKTLAARNRTIDRGFDSGGDRLNTGVPFSQDPGQDDYAGVPLSSAPFAAEDEFIQSRYDDYGGAFSYLDYLGISADGLTDYEIINKPGVRYGEVMLRADNDWLAATRQALPELRPTPRAWPQFAVGTPPATHRAPLAATGVVVPADVQARFTPPIDVEAGLAAQAARATSGNSATLDLMSMLLIVIVALLAASLAGNLWWCLSARRLREEVAIMTKEAMLRSSSMGSSGTDLRKSLSLEVEARAADKSATTVVGGGAAGQMSAAARFLPQVEVMCVGAAGDLVDTNGQPLPPCIAMERGESLQELSNRAELDLFTALAVLSNISMFLADMHDAGYIHRDVKPANVMWLPRENRWTVIDAGSVTGIGEAAPLSFTLAYAPPEVVDAYQNGDPLIESTKALNAWSLGVMAFELLTGAPAFKLLTDGRCRVIAQLRGDVPLPWEGELSSETVRKLGAFKGPVLQLLQREPSRRVSMRRFHVACTTLFASCTTVEL